MIRRIVSVLCGMSALALTVACSAEVFAAEPWRAAVAVVGCGLIALATADE